MSRLGLPAARVAAALLAAFLVLAPPAARADDDGEYESSGYTAVTGVGAALCTLLYTPLKVVYAGGGSVISGLAWLWTVGNTDVSGPIFRSAVRGDYVVTPAHLEGRRDLEFVGPQY